MQLFENKIKYTAIVLIGFFILFGIVHIDAISNSSGRISEVGAFEPANGI